MSKPIQSGPDLLSGVESLGDVRGRPRALVPAEALKVALELVNEEGLGALTLRRLATELGVGTATVHHTFGGKEQLLQALADTVFAELPDVESLVAPNEVEAMVEYFADVHLMLVSRPAIAQLSVIRRMHNPALFRAQETVLELLRKLNVDGQDAYDAYDALTNYVFGFSLNRISRQDFDRHQLVAGLPVQQYPALKRIAPFFDKRGPEDQLRVGVRRILQAFLPAPRPLPGSSEGPEKA